MTISAEKLRKSKIYYYYPFFIIEKGYSLLNETIDNPSNNWFNVGLAS